jgi:hypothetical protein
MSNDKLPTSKFPTRFLQVQHNKTGKNMPIDHKKYRPGIKCRLPSCRLRVASFLLAQHTKNWQKFTNLPQNIPIRYQIY